MIRLDAASHCKNTVGVSVFSPFQTHLAGIIAILLQISLETNVLLFKRLGVLYDMLVLAKLTKVSEEATYIRDQEPNAKNSNY